MRTETTTPPSVGEVYIALNAVVVQSAAEQVAPASTEHDPRT
jgi:hypothetical protein